MRNFVSNKNNKFDELVAASGHWVYWKDENKELKQMTEELKANHKSLREK